MKKLIVFCLYLLCYSGIVASDNPTIVGIITGYCGFFTEPNYKSISSEKYTFEPLQAIEIANNAEIIDDTFIAVIHPSNKTIIFLNKKFVFYDNNIHDVNVLTSLAKDQMYKDQLKLWEIPSLNVVFKPETSITNIFDSSELIHYSLLEQVPNSSRYNKKIICKDSEYYTNEQYFFNDMQISVRNINNKKFITSIILLKGKFDNNIYIGIKRYAFNDLMGIPNNYSKLFQDIEWNISKVRYQTNKYTVIFNFSIPKNYSNNDDFEDGMNYELSSIEIENYINIDELP